jgi:uncharacterized protein
MQLDVKNLTFGAIGETDHFDLSMENWKVAEDLVAKDLKGKIKLTRLDESILVQAEGFVKILLDCDRCLVNFEQELSFDFSQEYFLGGFRENEEELLVSKNFEIDIEGPIREEIILAMPVKKLCHKGCRGLCPHCGTSLNTEKCSCGKAKNKKV